MEFTGRRFRRWLGKKQEDRQSLADFYTAAGVEPIQPSITAPPKGRYAWFGQ